MNRVGALRACGRHDRFGVQVALVRARAADAKRALGNAHRQRFAVRLGIDLHGLQSELLARADDPQRDLAAVGHEHAPKRNRHQRGSITIKTWPYSTGSPSVTRICDTTPFAPAGIEFMSFITSMMQTIVPAATSSPM